MCLSRTRGLALVGIGVVGILSLSWYRGEATPPLPPRDQTDVQMSLAAGDRVVVGGKETTLDDLGALLRSQIDEEQPVITIDCAEDVLMESLYQVHAILRAAGTYKVRYKGSGSPPVPLELPSKELMQKAQSIPAEHVAHLAVAAGGRCTLDAATIDTSDVRALVGERAAADDLLIVSLRMAPDATYGQYLRILGQLKAAHAHRVFVDEPGAS